MKTRLLTLAIFTTLILFRNISFAQTGNIGIGTPTPESKLDVNGQLTIQQKNFGGYGGLLIKGGILANWPNLGFSLTNPALAQPDVIGGLIMGNIISNTSGSEAMDLTFHTTNTGFAGLSERLRIKDNGNVGIGLNNPGYKLHLGSAANGLRIEGPATSNTGASSLSIGGTGSILVDKPGLVGGRFAILENGNVGIGTVTPAHPLSFSNALGEKINLYDNGVNNYGIGVQGSTLQIHGAVATDDVAFGTGSSTAFSEKFRFNGEGSFAVNGNTGNKQQILTSEGNGASPVWRSANNIIKYGSSGITASGNDGILGLKLTGNTIFDLTNSTIVLNIDVPSKLILNYKCFEYKTCIAGSCATKWLLTVYVNGVGHPGGNYYIDGQAYGVGNGSLSNNTVGPDYIDLSVGTHTISFKAQNQFNEPDIRFQAMYTLVPL